MKLQESFKGKQSELAEPYRSRYSSMGTLDHTRIICDPFTTLLLKKVIQQLLLYVSNFQMCHVITCPAFFTPRQDECNKRNGFRIVKKGIVEVSLD